MVFNKTHAFTILYNPFKLNDIKENLDRIEKLFNIGLRRTEIAEHPLL